MKVYPTLTIRLQLFALALHFQTSVPINLGRPSYRQWTFIITGRKFVQPGKACLTLLFQWNETKLLDVRALVYPVPRFRR